MPMLGVDADSVRALFIAGMSTAAIAATHGVGQRRVQQLVADLPPARATRRARR
jgi:sensor histidine kinase regulating citrate/malate metabolism